MILTNLKLTNFGVFHGCQVIDLSPRPGRPIILFGGKNGAGKSTVLEAIRVCLYGPLALGPRVAKDEYSRYLEGKIHFSPTLLIPPNFASVEIEFDYADSDGVHAYAIRRSWERRSPGRVEENVQLTKDSEPIDDISAEHSQEFVRDLVPPGVSQFFFFDGEKIQQLAEDSSDQATLTDAIHSLLGIDLLDRLAADLTIYASRTIKPLQSEHQASEDQQLASEIAELEQKIASLTSESLEAEQSISSLSLELSKIEATLSSQGGAYAQNRQKLVAEKAKHVERIKQLEEALRSSANGLLPFCFTRDLLFDLKKQLANDDENEKRASGTALLHDASAAVLRKIKRSNLDSRHKVRLAAEISKVFDDVGGTRNSKEVVHPLAPSVRRELFSQIDQVSVLRDQIREQCKKLEQASRSLHKTEGQLLKAPADDVIAPILNNFRATSERLHAAKHRLTTIIDARVAAENKLRELIRRRDGLLSARAKSELLGTKLEMLPRVHSVLQQYKTALIQRKIRELETSVSHCFHILSRKKDILRRIYIDPDTAAIVLKDKKGNAIPKSQLSAGEKQIYAISMLWALAKTSGRPLPVIIDTPLGRLDSDHRALLADYYFPVASQQVIILSTDTEIDRTYFDAMSKTIAKTYTFDFDELEHGTKIREGYFWEGGVYETHEASALQRSV